MAHSVDVGVVAELSAENSGEILRLRSSLATGSPGVSPRFLSRTRRRTSPVNRRSWARLLFGEADILSLEWPPKLRQELRLIIH